jgi:DNA repair photolyase
LIKENAIDLLRKELASKRVKGTIGTGSMNDPYMPLEADVNLTGRALTVIAQFGFPVHVMTKSDLVLRDLDTLCQISRTYAAVSFTITTADDELGRRLEPGAPLVSDRLRAMRALNDRGVYTGVTMMPLLPFIEDDEANVRRIIQLAHAHGAAYIVPWFGMSLRDRQRAYYYDRLDDLFPGLRRRYERTFGDQYACSSPHVNRLSRVFEDLCEHYDIATRMQPYRPVVGSQMRLL